MAHGEFLTWWNCPPVIRRHVRNAVLGAIAFSCAAIALVLVRDPLGIPREPWGRYGPLVFGLMPIGVVWPLFVLRRVRIRKQFNDARGRLCTHCAYNLLPMNDQGICPECGKPFDASADAETWQLAGFKM